MGQDEPGPTTTRRARPLVDRFDAGCLGCLGLLVAFGALAGTGSVDTPEEARALRWQLVLGLAGMLVALALARYLPRRRRP